MNYLKYPRGNDGDFEQSTRKRLTPASEMSYEARGILGVSLQTSRGLCKATSKCVLKSGHTAPCWPGD